MQEANSIAAFPSLSSVLVHAVRPDVMIWRYGKRLIERLTITISARVLFIVSPLVDWLDCLGSLCITSHSGLAVARSLVAMMKQGSPVPCLPLPSVGCPAWVLSLAVVGLFPAQSFGHPFLVASAFYCCMRSISG